MGIKWKRKANIDIYMWRQRRKSRGAKAVELCSIDEAALEFEERRVSCGFSLSSSNMRHCEPVNVMTKTCSCCFFWIRVE